MSHTMHSNNRQLNIFFKSENRNRIGDNLAKDIAQLQKVMSVTNNIIFPWRKIVLHFQFKTWSDVHKNKLEIPLTLQSTNKCLIFKCNKSLGIKKTKRKLYFTKCIHFRHKFYKKRTKYFRMIIRVPISFIISWKTNTSPTSHKIKMSIFYTLYSVYILTFKMF